MIHEKVIDKYNAMR